MTENEEQLTEQIAALTIATADMTFGLAGKLVSLKVMSQEQGEAFLRQLADHNRDLARRNEQFSGMATAFRQIADRIDRQIAEVKAAGGPPRT